MPCLAFIPRLQSEFPCFRELLSIASSARCRKQLESIRESRPTDLENRKPFRYRSTAAYCFLIREERVQRSSYERSEAEHSAVHTEVGDRRFMFMFTSALFSSVLPSVPLDSRSIVFRPVPSRPGVPRAGRALLTHSTLDSTRERTSPNASCLLLRSLN